MPPHGLSVPQETDHDSNLCSTDQRSRTWGPTQHSRLSTYSPSLCRSSWFGRLTADLGYTTWTRPWTSDPRWPFCSGSMKNSPLSVRISPACRTNTHNHASGKHCDISLYDSRVWVCGVTAWTWNRRNQDSNHNKYWINNALWAHNPVLIMNGKVISAERVKPFEQVLEKTSHHQEHN